MRERANEDWPLYEDLHPQRSRDSTTSTSAACTRPTTRMALDHARDLYTRRLEGVSIWVVRSADIVASDPAENDAFFEPAEDKIYRHPTFYDIPDEVKTL